MTDTDFGTVKYLGKEFMLTQNAYHHGIRECYIAHAKDVKGNRYLVEWEIINHNCEEDEACDWDDLIVTPDFSPGEEIINVYYLEFYDTVDKTWTNEIGEYNDFETLEEAINIIADLEECEIGVGCEWRILENNENIIWRCDSKIKQYH